MHSKEAVLVEIDEVLARCGATADRPWAARQPQGDAFYQSARGNETAMLTACVGAIERNSPRRSYIDMAHELAARGTTVTVVDDVIGVLVTVRKDIEQGYLGTLEQQAREVVYEDFLEMADDIATKMHPAPAVVLAVSVLEEHVRKLAEARTVATTKSNGDPRGFEDIITDLGAGDDPPLSKTERRLLGGWYSQRTEAAHGHFDKVIAANVGGIIMGVRDFLVRHPA